MIIHTFTKIIIGIIVLVTIAISSNLAFAIHFDEGYMIVNPDRNLFTDKKLSGIMGHFSEQSIVYAKHSGGINMYELMFVVSGENGGTEYTKAYIVIAKHRNGEVCDIEMKYKAGQVKFVEPDQSLDVYAARGPVASAANEPAPASGPYDFDQQADF